MQGDEPVAPRARQDGRIDARGGQDVLGPLGLFPVEEQGVDHDVADEADSLGRDALALQIGRCVPLGGVEAIGDLVGEDAVDFFRHGPVETAQTCFHMHGGYAALDGDETARQG